MIDAAHTRAQHRLRAEAAALAADEHAAAVDPERLGAAAGRLTLQELRQVEAALRLVLSL